MPLNNFGSILNFAEQIEAGDYEFYTQSAQNCTDNKTIFEQFAADAQKNQKNIQRIRRENVTEMILEGINNFTRAPYSFNYPEPEKLTPQEALQTAENIEKRALNYYTDAAEKIKALPEVSRGLKQAAKKHKAHLNKL